MSYIRLEQRQDQTAWCDLISRMLAASLAEDRCLCCSQRLQGFVGACAWLDIKRACFPASVALVLSTGSQPCKTFSQ